MHPNIIKKIPIENIASALNEFAIKNDHTKKTNPKNKKNIFSIKAPIIAPSVA